jgi:predicted RecA/RadA family phage recombinase
VANECIPLFRPGGDITCLTTGAVTGKRMVGVSATRDASTGLIKVAHATAATRALGVAVKDTASGDRVAVVSGPGVIVPVTAGGTIAFGAEVEVGTSGQVVTLASGKAVGMAVEAGTNGNDIHIRLY